MSRFDRYMLSQLMMFFGFFALVLVSIYWVNSAVHLFDRLISDNQSVWVFLELSALSLPTVISRMLPVAAFAAVLYATNRMAQESELVVMQATGFSPFRLARPVLFFGLIVALLMSALTHGLVPLARTRQNERNVEISENITARILTEGSFEHPAAGLTLFIRTIAPSGELLDLFLSDRRAPGSETSYFARRAYLAKSQTGPKLVMLDGLAQTYDRASKRLSATKFENFTYDIAALIAAKGPRVAALDERSTLSLLRASPALLAETGETRSSVLFNGHERFTNPLLAISLTLVAFAAMQGGSFTRFGMWRQIAGASGLFLILFLLTNIASKQASRHESAVPALYLPALIGLVLAAILLVRAGRKRRPRPLATEVGGA
ncbi:MAG: LPS export ABC transporter permease LptF [Rhodobacteraceae bacterium]|nr:LPS export ABC transporter permease LptF [Paracoccaceae bacterium]